jgi:probable selenium-dependent hydroxylase accessory protein YqeC
MKLDGFSPEEAGAFREGAGMLLIEADGARGLAAKAPGPGEPVIPRWVDAVLGVVGLTIIGAPLDEARVFRSELFGQVTGLAPGSPIGPEAIGRLAHHRDGLFKGAAAGTRKLIVLNQGDAVEGLEKLEQIAYIVWRIAGAPRGPAERVLCTSLRGGARVLHQLPAD